MGQVLGADGRCAARQPARKLLHAPFSTPCAEAETTIKPQDTTGTILGKSVTRLAQDKAAGDEAAKDPTYSAEVGELKRLDDQICQLRRKHDELAHSNMTKRQELDRIADKLRDLAKESVRPGHDDHPSTKEIRKLERKLAASVARYEEAYENRRTYDQIMKRLKEERTNYDNSIAELDARLRAKEAEYEELLLMSHDANHSKEMAKAELTRLEAIAVEERKLRDRELQDQRQLVMHKTELNKQLQKREKASLANDVPSADLPEGVKRNQLYLHLLNDTSIEEEQKNIRAYEAAFQKIKEVTGVSDVSEVIEKFLTQEETHKHLQQMTKDSQARIEALHEQKRRAEEQVQRLKYTSSKPGASRRPNARTGGEGVNDAQSKYERMRNKHEHMKSVFQNVRAGVENIARQLEADKLLQEIPIEHVTAKDLMALLDDIEARATTLLEAIDLEEEAMEAAQAVVAPPKKGAVPAELDLGPGNIRIKDPTEREEEVHDDEDFEEDIEEDVVDRETLKKQAANILDKAAKGKKKRRRRNAAAADDA